MEAVYVVETKEGWAIRCHACTWHEFPKGRGWTFNGNVHSPDFQPSMNETINSKTSPYYDPEWDTRICHFFIRQGKIEYLGDCTHRFKGQTLPLEAWPESEVKYYKALLEAK